MSLGLVTVYGGSGFVGRHLVRDLARQGWRVRVAVRRPDLAGHLQPLGAVGQIMPVQANLRHAPSVDAAARGADAVVNLVGILHEGGRQKFGAVQADGARRVAEAAAKAGAKTLVQISAIGADEASPARYAQTKAFGEQGVLAAFPGAIILRPSVIFGPEDNFFNMFANLARYSPVLPLIGGGETKFQPVFVGDVAAAIMAALEGKAKPGAVYELGGPQVISFKGVLEYILKVTGRNCLLVPLPWGLARFQAGLLEMLPSPLLTTDQVTMLQTDNVVSTTATAEERDLSGLGISPTAMEAVVPGYLYRFRKHGQFEPRRKTTQGA